MDFASDSRGEETRGYVGFPVRCEAVLDRRERPGLPRDPPPPLPLAIGNG